MLVDSNIGKSSQQLDLAHIPVFTLGTGKLLTKIGNSSFGGENWILEKSPEDFQPGTLKFRNGFSIIKDINKAGIQYLLAEGKSADFDLIAQVTRIVRDLISNSHFTIDQIGINFLYSSKIENLLQKKEKIFQSSISTAYGSMQAFQAMFQYKRRNNDQLNIRLYSEEKSIDFLFFDINFHHNIGSDNSTERTEEVIDSMPSLKREIEETLDKMMSAFN
ncbi:MAG: hypothetical protein ABW189_00400 [Rickettsiales bacterium]